MFSSALQKKVLIPSMYFANYSKSNNMSVDKVCIIKHFEFACMTILSPDTLSICFIIDMQVSPYQPKTIKILAQNPSKMH